MKKNGGSEFLMLATGKKRVRNRLMNARAVESSKRSHTEKTMTEIAQRSIN
jgi:hypothetical protein